MRPGGVPTGFSPFSGELGGNTGDADRPDASKRSAPTADASADGGSDIRELEHRVAVLEERLARLEGACGED